jgi:uncharacterized membrane protein YidH (DUF202 family)
LAAERTDLAWNRSGLAFLVCIAVLCRRLWPLHGADQVIALAAVSVGAAAWALALRIGRAVSWGMRDRRGVLGGGALALMTAGTVALAAAGFVLGLFAPGT